MLCEHDLAQERLNAPKGKIDPALLLAAESARSTVNRTLMANDQRNGPSVKIYLLKNEAGMCVVDRFFQIEVQFFSEMVGAAGERCLQDKVRAVMPTVENARTIDESLAAIREIMGSDLYRFTGSGAQGVIQSVEALLESLKLGTSPTFAANPSDFLIGIKSSLAFFCRCKGEPVEGRDTELVGSPAAVELANHAIKSSKATLKDLELPTKFAWLLPAELSQAVAALRDRLVKEACAATTLDTAGGGAGASSSSASGRKRGLGAESSPASNKAKASEVDAAMSMFRSGGK